MPNHCRSTPIAGRAPARVPLRAPLIGVAAALVLAANGIVPATAQDNTFWDRGDSYGDQRRSSPARAPRRDDAYRPPDNGDGPAGGFGSQAGPDGRPVTGGGYAGQYGGSYGSQYGAQPPAYSSPPTYDQRPPATGAPGYEPRSGYGAPAYDPPRQSEAWRQPGYGQPRGNDAYQPPDRQAGWSDNRGYAPPPSYQPDPRDGGGYGQPYAAPPNVEGPPPGAPGGYGQDGYRQDGYPRPDGRAGYDDQRRWDDRAAPSNYSQNEVVNAGHRFFGSISQGLANAIEHAFKSKGRPNGYILGEDAGGAFVAGLRYGEGVLHTKDVGNHRVFWQGPSLGYDFGGEGSKTMVLVYNLRDPADIYSRFAGVQGSVYVVGGVSVQFQTHENVTLAVIRSGVGLRLGANVGYLKYTRAPTWNPF